MADIAASAPASGSPSEGSASAPSTGTTVQSGEGTTTGQATTGQPVVQPQSTEPPRERWDSILANARQKSRAEAEAEFNRRFEPYQDFEADPWSAVQNWLERAERHSVYGPLVKQYHQAKQQSAQPAAEPQPDVPIVDEQNRITGKTYSADRLREWHRWNDVQTQAKLDARFGPIEQRERQQAQQEQQARQRQDADQYAHTTLTELRTQPYYKEHEPAIREALMAHPEWGSNVHRAYMHVMTTAILPKLRAKEVQATLDSITQQGDATTVAPGTTAVGQPKFKSFGSAAKYFSEHLDEAAAMAGRR